MSFLIKQSLHLPLPELELAALFMVYGKESLGKPGQVRKL